MPDPQVIALAVVGVVLLLAAWGISLPVAAARADRRSTVVSRARFEALAREAARRRGELR